MREASRLLSDATEAFVDRAPIDWAALLRRVRASPDRALFENLRQVAAVRDRYRTARPAGASAGAPIAAWLVVALASIETLGLLSLTCAALAAGESIAGRMPQLVLALTFAAASLPLGPSAARDPRSLSLLATFASASAVFARSTTTGLPPSWSAAFDGILGRIWIEAFLPACLWQFALDFPRVLRFTGFDSFARRAATLAWLIGTALFVVNLAGATGIVQTTPLSYLLRNHSSRMFWRVFTLALAPALAAILVRSRRAPASERRRVARLALAISGGLGPFLLLGIVRIVVPSVDDWFRASSSEASIWLRAAIVVALAATPVLSTVAVLADRPFELHSLLRRRSTSGLADSLRRLSFRRTQRPARLVLAIERIAQARGTRETAAVLAQQLRDTVGVRSVRVLLRQSDGDFSGSWNGASTLRSDGALVALLRGALEPLDVSPGSALDALLPACDREWTARHRVHVVAPLRQPHTSGGAIDDLCAIVAMGPKSGGVPFDRRDHLLIVALIGAAATPVGGGRHASGSPIASGDEVALECPDCGLVAASGPLRCACRRDAVLAALPHCLAGKFRVSRRIGSGGMGIAYLARDMRLDRDVALKTLPGLGSRAVRRLRDEARSMAALNHEALATLYGLEMWRGTPVLVVEFFPQGMLSDRLMTGPLPASQALDLGLRLARALTYMHEKGVLHRDLKPSNIGFTANGAAKLLDFGLARLNVRGKHPEDDEWPAGTRDYLPPEALRGAPASSAVDRWALAVVMLEACPSLTTVPSVRALFDRALAASPDRRFQTTAEFAAALEAAAGATLNATTPREQA